ncbi:PhnD/SsuA/transferrin family substrate-binding protein [Peptoniphilus equinus]|uniref:PhnD/SsuA/transferrin family substrate-binding protein n=1 Tax=Peptoniphilus equinus TaxID=3016343 RepID=A0ABY7QSB7_9FIRM|nr:PhnD/SsuA/transferrin family substrate-binding protein [Peptoniphilus equinus]WBW49361.1 PhnD/SsuA/transferrin family substrate-binding protein [Peptoniphilus equinus]
MKNFKFTSKLALIFSLVAVLALSTACAGDQKEDSANTAAETTENAEATTSIDKLSIQFVPSRDPQEIVTATEPLKTLLKDQLKTQGIDVGEVDITVGTNYEATGEALSAGTVDVGFIPGGTYVLYDDGADVILTATRKGLSVDSDLAKDWNDNKPTTQSDEQVTFYRALMLAGPSEKGRELAAKVNAGEELSWDDLNSANWSVMGPSSPAGYIYPYLTLQDNYQKGITDLANVVQADSYASAFARLASGQIDVLACFADARLDYQEQWTTEFGGKNDIFTDVDVIGVTDKIYNDTISVSKNSEIMTDEFKAQLTQAFMEIAKTPEGKEVIAIYSHEGYQEANAADYDAERKAQDLIKEMKNN